MSYTEIYAFGKDGDAYLYKEIPNSFRGAMAVWTILEEKYLPQYRPSYVPASIPDSEIKDYCNYKPSRCMAFSDEEAMQEIWDLTKDDKVTDEDKIVLMTTFDNIVIAKKDLEEVRRCYKKFDGETSLGEQADVLEEMLLDRNIIAVGWNQTSVNGDTWENFNYDEDEDEYTPYNILTGDSHKFIFEGGL